MIDLSLQQQSLIKTIVKQVFSDESIQVYVFGSRVTNKARTFSDVDLALKANSKISARKMAQLKEAFSESDLPFMVDVIDLNAISEDFYQSIEDNMVEMRLGKRKA